MPAQTTHGLPYPLGTDPFSDGDDSIKALAQAMEKPVAATALALAATWAPTPGHAAPGWYRIGPMAYLVGNFTNAAGGTFGTAEALLAPLPAAIKPANHVQASTGSFVPGPPAFWIAATVLVDVSRDNLYLNLSATTAALPAAAMNVPLNLCWLVA